MRLIPLVSDEDPLGVAASPLAASIASAPSSSLVAAPAPSPAGLARARARLLRRDLGKAVLLLRGGQPRELVPEGVPIEDLAAFVVEPVGGRGSALVELLSPARAQRRLVIVHAVGQQERPAWAVELDAQMLGDLGEVLDVTRDDEILITLEVLVGGES